MKVILSRKGLDSTFGGMPSLVFRESKSILSIPIPSNYDCDKTEYSELEFDGAPITDIFKDLGTPKRHGQPLDRCHLDPDLRKGFKKRTEWMPAFGQDNAASRHLMNKNVEPGDLFLFFGWFNFVEKDVTYKWKTDPNFSNGFHMIYGYLEVGEIFRGPEVKNCPKTVHGHPHFTHGDEELNTLFLPKERSSFFKGKSGAGMFDFDDRLILTKPGSTRSKWDLKIPSDASISYHNPQKYNTNPDYFQSALIGQEFVIEGNTDFIFDRFFNNQKNKKAA